MGQEWEHSMQGGCTSQRCTVPARSDFKQQATHRDNGAAQGDGAFDGGQQVVCLRGILEVAAERRTREKAMGEGGHHSDYCKQLEVTNACSPAAKTSHPKRMKAPLKDQADVTCPAACRKGGWKLSAMARH